MNFSAIISRQREFFQSGSTRTAEFRREQLQKLEHLLESHQDELLSALYADLRKSPADAYVSEIGFVLGEIRHALKHLSSWMKPAHRKSPLLAWPARSHVQQDPYGVSLIIGPWNYPLQLLLSPLVGALAAGNCAILKPSEFAPHTADILDSLIRSSFPGHFLTVIRGDRSVSEALLAEKFDTIFFTGGTETGRAVMSAAARHLTPVTLELGGKCPCIIGHDAPLEATAKRIAWGKFMNAGQTCVAPDHVWVDGRIAPEWIDAMKSALRGFYGDSPRHSPDYGRIINHRHFERLKGYLNDGSIAHGGETDAEDLYIAPTILTNTPLDSPVMSEEIFGPVLPVMTFSDIGDVLTELRRRPHPLAVYLFTRETALEKRVIAETQSGGVCVNDTILQILGNELPFGGVGGSGMGSYHGRASFDCFSHRRTVMRRKFGIDPQFRYPPAKTPLKWLKHILRYMG